MALRLRGSTSGFVEIDAPAVAGDVTLTLPSTAGTVNVKDASGNTEVGTGVTLGNPSADIFTINNIGGERLRIASDGTVTIPGVVNIDSAVTIGSSLNVAGVLTYEDVTSVDAIGLSTFRDGLNTKDVGMIEIDTTISDTAVDIFIYDTSKDSDGGAWRKRTSHTSWYNETLNTSTRGSRREFPAVAVLVLEGTKLTIYDGDDPDLPMWMVFNVDSDVVGGTTFDMIAGGSGTVVPTAVVMLNGILSVPLYAADGSSGGMPVINFISDSAINYRSVESSFTGAPYLGNIEQRNDSLGNAPDTNSRAIVSGSCNDVAMTVLPNAPIDSATGLPVPTIAVAADGGISVIKDDGTVVDAVGTTFDVVNSISFDKNNRIICSSGTDGTDQAFFSTFAIPSADLSNVFPGGDNGYYRDGYGSTDLPWYGSTGSAGNHFINEVSSYGDYISFGTEDDGSTLNPGLKILSENITTPSEGMLCGVSTSYNTGWMHGDIKGAFLSDTDTTNVTGSELVTNGTFDSNVNGWTAVNSTITYSSGTAVVNRTGGAGPSAYQEITTVVGEKYVVTGTVDSNGTGGRGDIRIYSDLASTMLVNAAGTDNQTVIVSATFTATTTTSYVYFSVDNTGTATFDNVSVRIAEADRSVNNKGLQVFGTITKSAVATGADLVGYSGYSASNYFTQPNITAPGTGDFSIIFWIKPGTLDAGTGNYVHVFSLGTSSTGGQGRSTGFVLKLTTYTAGSANGYIPYFYNDDGGQDQGTYNASNHVSLGEWSQLVAMRRGGVPYIYLNGNLMQTGNSWPTNLTDTYLTLFNGIGYAEHGGDAEFALLRYSLSAPSAAQVKKMYEDEKVLFQENSQATLYGSSDAVTALAYDEVTDQLHVGTSSGRSDFQGLRRINNTTVGITTAISAHDSFIIEQ